jgi:hypothetical protein
VTLRDRPLIGSSLHRQFEQVAGNSSSGVTRNIAFVQIVTEHRADSQFLDGSLVNDNLGRTL